MAAERRCFSSKITDSDSFLDMPFSAQALYYQLGMRADDDGFINNAKRITGNIGATADDLQLLIDKRFLLHFSCGVVVIKHWKLHNTLRKDRMKPLSYPELAEKIWLKDRGIYTDNPVEGALTLLEYRSSSNNDGQMSVKCLSNDSQKCLTNDGQLPDICQPKIREEEEEEGSKEKISQFEENERLKARLTPALDHSIQREIDSDVFNRDDFRREVLYGELGGGVVVLSQAQFEDLLDKLSLEEFEHYVAVVRDNELSGKRYKKKTHYQAILDMAAADRATI